MRLLGMYRTLLMFYTLCSMFFFSRTHTSMWTRLKCHILITNRIDVHRCLVRRDQEPERPESDIRNRNRLCVCLHVLHA